MEVKPKKCKGIRKAHGFEGCGTVTIYRKFGLCDTCRSEFLTTTERGKIILSKLVIKVQKPRKEQENTMQKMFDDKRLDKSLKTSKNTTKTIVHAYVRKRDQGKPCVSCLEPWNSTHQAGHFHKSELFETLKYNLDNINNQCVGCNIHKDGNLEQYIINLPKRIGKERFDKLMRLAQIDKKFTKVWNLENLKEIRKNIKILTQKLK